MKLEEVHLFEKTQSQLEGLLTEISVLVKKSPNDAVNKFKLKFINEIIINGNKILGTDYKPLASFEQFEEDDLPSTSDVTFIISQYLNCFDKMKSDNITRVQAYDGNKYFFEWFWKLEDTAEEVKTNPPTKVK